MRRLRIVTLWYPPEQPAFGVMMRELAEFLTARDWEVEVLTARPSHPACRIFDGWRGRTGITLEDDVPVRRLRHLVVGGRRTIARAIAQLSFSLAVAWNILRTRRDDVVLAPLQPLFLGPLLGIACRLRGVPLVWLVQDLHPDALVDLGLLREGSLVSILRWCERIGYRLGTGTISICPAFARHVRARRGSAVSDSDVDRVIRNWCRPDVLAETPSREAARRRLGLPPDDPILLFAGTLSHSSGADLLIEVSRHLAAIAPAVRVVVVGEGALRPAFDEAIARGDAGRLEVRDFVPAERLPDVLGSADVAVVTMDPASSMNSLPSKSVSYLGAGLPIVSDCPEGSPLHDELQAAGAAVFSPPRDALAMAMVVAGLAGSVEERRRLGAAGRRYVEEELHPEIALSRYAAVLEEQCR